MAEFIRDLLIAYPAQMLGGIFLTLIVTIATSTVLRSLR